MILEQFYLGCLAHASYLVADERTRVAAIVDPQRDVDVYLERARALGLEIRHVLLTHFHADFVAGHIELERRTKARIYLGERAKAEYAFTALRDGDALEFGDVRLSILETPGHTPEGISIVVHDLRKSDRDPHAVLTGDTLFIGDVGRPDLLASVGVTADELGALLYDSLHGKLLALPDATLVYPAHGAGSMCGKRLSTESVSTIGEQRRYNYALQPMSKREFVALVTADQPEAPAYFLYNATLNRMERATLDEALEQAHKPLTLDALRLLANQGAQVIDVRAPAAFAAGHFAGALNIALDGSFATWVGSLLDPKRLTVVIAESGRESEAALRMARVGFDHVAGFLAGGVSQLANQEALVARTRRMTVQALAEQLDGAHPPLVLDVRTPAEWKAGHIDGALHVPLQKLAQRTDELPRDRDLAVVCRTGYRSSIATSLLARAGFERLYDVVGGMEAWKLSGEQRASKPSSTNQAR
ncbi:MAG: MBL fold metallo-hydrolase [Planctomycetes bacterium]|nr:MBL fold metallo-hydrolase [Planctomycetota bacterium]